MLHKLITYAHSNLRHHLVVLNSEVEGLHYVNIGKVLATALCDHVDEEDLHTLAANRIANIVKTSITHHNQLGKYIALTNLHILFEPELKFDVPVLLDSWSKHTLLIINLNNEEYPNLKPTHQ